MIWTIYNCRDQPGGNSGVLPTRGHTRRWGTYAALGLGAVAVIGLAWLLWLLLKPPSPNFSLDQGQGIPNAAYAQGGPGCDPEELSKSRGVHGLGQRERCAEKAEGYREQGASIAQAVRGAKASEQGALEAYFQARAVAAQSVLLFLAFAAAIWAAWEARAGAKAVNEQVRLANKDFEATHRPWVAVRSATLRTPAIRIGVFSIEVDVEYKIENTSNVPALEVLASGIAIPRTMDENIDRIQRRLLETYAEISRVAPTPQEMIVFPGETTDYRVNVEMIWRNVEDETEISPVDLGDLLVTVSFIYVDARERRLRTTSCTHRVTSVITDADVRAARQGTGVLKEGHIGKWRLGWSAT